MNDNEYSLLSDYSFDGNIYLYDANDFYRNSQFDSERKNFIQSRYFTKVIKNIRTDNFNQFVKQYNKIFSDFNEKYLKLTDYGQKSLDKELVTKLKDNYENISDNILNGISFIINPLIEYKLNINKLYNNLVVNNDIPFIYYIGDKTGLSKIKLYESSYYGDNAFIKKDKLKEWKNVKFSLEEKELFSKKNILILILNLNQNYIKFHINTQGKILVNSYELKNTGLTFDLIIKKINMKIINKINKIITINKIDNLNEEQIDIIELNGSKKININENLDLDFDNSNLNNILNYYNEFIYFKNKHPEKDINRYLDKKKQLWNKKIKRLWQ